MGNRLKQATFSINSIQLEQLQALANKTGFSISRTISDAVTFALANGYQKATLSGGVLPPIKKQPPNTQAVPPKTKVALPVRVKDGSSQKEGESMEDYMDRLDHACDIGKYAPPDEVT